MDAGDAAPSFSKPGIQRLFEAMDKRIDAFLDLHYVTYSRAFKHWESCMMGTSIHSSEAQDPKRMLTWSGGAGGPLFQSMATSRLCRTRPRTNTACKAHRIDFEGPGESISALLLGCFHWALGISKGSTGSIVDPCSARR